MFEDELGDPTIEELFATAKKVEAYKKVLTVFRRGS